jgi:hypothetical protein
MQKVYANYVIQHALHAIPQAHKIAIHVLETFICKLKMDLLAVQQVVQQVIILMILIIPA